MGNKENIPDKKQEEKDLYTMEKVLSPGRAIVKIIIAIFAFLWFLAGGSAQTVLSLSGGSLGLVGLVSFLIRNPITFLIIGIIQVVLGLIFYLFFAEYYFMVIFHFLWSVRWFYGYKKYLHLKIPDKD